MHRLILASASPQRKELLTGLGLTFEVIPSNVDEDGHPERKPAERSQILARLKALDVHAKHPQAFVIGCDTLVVSANGSLLEKPASPEEAEHMLRSQSGSTSVVHSALCIVNPAGQVFEELSSSSVTFKALNDKEIAWWVQGNLWKGRSGGFQIDGLGQLMISRIEGDWTSIVGLPVFLLGKLLSEAGYPIF